MAAKLKPAANPEFAAAMREIRRSSRTSPHADRRDRRARTRQGALNRELRDAA